MPARVSELDARIAAQKARRNAEVAEAARAEARAVKKLRDQTRNLLGHDKFVILNVDLGSNSAHHIAVFNEMVGNVTKQYLEARIFPVFINTIHTVTGHSSGARRLFATSMFSVKYEIADNVASMSIFFSKNAPGKAASAVGEDMRIMFSGMVKDIKASKGSSMAAASSAWSAGWWFNLEFGRDPYSPGKKAVGFQENRASIPFSQLPANILASTENMARTQGRFYKGVAVSSHEVKSSRPAGDRFGMRPRRYLRKARAVTKAALESGKPTLMGMIKEAWNASIQASQKASMFNAHPPDIFKHA